jgi:hypothetical protein
MLYDPKWEVTTNPLSLESFIAWLETRNPTETYDFFCADECLVGQWVKSIDKRACRIPSRDSAWYVVNRKMVNLRKFVTLANSADEFTFGGTLARARDAMALTSHNSQEGS